jgi:anti-sigma factor RsiW
MTCAHEMDVGAYVLDALEPDERGRVREHLAGCAECQATLRELEGLSRLLAQVPAPVTGAPVFSEAPSELAYRRLQHRATELNAAMPASKHGSVPAAAARAAQGGARRWVLVAAAAAVVGVAGGAGGVVASHGPAAPTAVSATDGEVHGRAQLTPSSGGTTISLALNGVPSGQRCQLWAVSRDGRWATASDWTANYFGTAQVVGAVPIRPQDIDRLVIRTPDGRTLLTMPS